MEQKQKPSLWERFFTAHELPEGVMPPIVSGGGIRPPTMHLMFFTNAHPPQDPPVQATAPEAADSIPS